MTLEAVDTDAVAPRPTRGWFNRNRGAVARHVVINFFLVFILAPLVWVIVMSFKTLPDAMRGQGSGIIQTFRNFGSAIGMAIMGSIVAGATDLTGASGPQDFADAMQTAFYVGAAMLGLGYIATQLLMRGGKQEGIE